MEVRVGTSFQEHVNKRHPCVHGAQKRPLSVVVDRVDVGVRGERFKDANVAVKEVERRVALIVSGVGENAASAKQLGEKLGKGVLWCGPVGTKQRVQSRYELGELPGAPLFVEP